MSSFLDRYVARESPVHRLDPRVKLLATLAFIVGNLLLPDGAWAGFALAWLVVLVASALATLGLGFVVRRSFIALPFLLAGFSVVFATPGNPVAQWRFAWLDLTVTDAGLVRLGSLMLRTWLSVQMAILLTATTSFPDLTHALRHLHVPPVLVSIVSFMYRYLFVLVDESQRLLRARASRCALQPGLNGGGTLRWRAAVAGNMAGQLLVRGMDRADRVYLGMLARGYRGELLTMNPHTMTARDWQALGVSLAALLLIQIAGRVAAL